MILNSTDLTKLAQSTESLTIKKTLEIMERDQSFVTGFIVTSKDGDIAIVNNSAVRWMSKENLWNLMHGE